MQSVIVTKMLPKGVFFSPKICQNVMKCPRFGHGKAFYNKVEYAVPRFNHHFLLNMYIHSQRASFQKSLNKTINKYELSKAVNRYSNRTHTCGELSIDNLGNNVHLYGWLEFQRMGKFFVLRDAYGSTQCIIHEKKKDLSKTLQSLSYESVVGITGIVVSRPKNQSNSNMETGDIEIQVDSIEILNTAMLHLPFYIRNYSKAKEPLQMQYRYLALRYPELQKNLRIRSWVIMKMREYLIYKCGFVDVTTPTLFRKTPGGAQEFIVPTKYAGKCYSLVQSPQQFKQLLMVGGIDRYFQVAQCYRDEGSRSDRQPEFTQLDIEASFIEKNDIINITEELIRHSWPEFLDSVQIPFQRLTYEDAMEIYGTDSPDLRIPGRIHYFSHHVNTSTDNLNKSHEIYGTAFSGKQASLIKSVKDKLTILSKQIFEKASLIQLTVSDTKLPELKTLFSLSTIQNIVDRLNLQKGDVLFLSYGEKLDARQLLGKIRVEFVNILESEGTVLRSPGYKFVWIYDFPLFTLSSCKTLETTHHPFTQPHPDDINKLNVNPLEVRGLQYDLVLNGSEIGGGSIRIHQNVLQKNILEMLNIDASKMHYFMEALDCGAPPHGGIALGLDRYISILCKAPSIRDVIAFPKSIEGRDLMSGAPSFISEKDKKMYHIQIINDIDENN